MRIVGSNLPTALVASFVSLLPATALQAQSEVVPAAYTVPDPGLTVERIEQLRREAAATPGIDEAKRKIADDTYLAAQACLQAAAGFVERALALEAETASVAERLGETRHRLEEAAGEGPPVNLSGELATLQQELAQLEIAQANQKKKHAALEAEPQVRAQRRKEIRARIAVVTEALNSDSADASPAVSAEEPFIAAPKAVELAARRTAMEQELPALQNELAKYDAEDAVDLLQLRIDLAAKRLARYDQAIQKLSEAVKTQRDAAAKESVRKARFEAIHATPVLKSHAEENHALAESAQAIAQLLSKAEQQLKSSREAYSAIEKQYQLTRQKIDAVGLTSSVGALLRKQRATLPNPDGRRAEIAARRVLIDDTQYQQFDYADERQDLADLDAMVARVVATVGLPPGGDVASLETAAREVLERKRSYLDTLIKTSSQYFDALVDLDTTDRQVVSLTQEFAEFIDERVLWIRSGRLLTSDFSLDDSDMMLADPDNWVGFAKNLYRDAFRAPAGFVAAVVVLCFSLLRAGRIRRHIAAVGEVAEKASCRTMAPTLDALASTVLVAMILPGACALLGWRLNRLDDPFTSAIGSGLLNMSLLWAPMEIFRQICRPKGLGESHFGWPTALTHVLRRRLRWFSRALLPIAFVTAMLVALDTSHGSDAVERISFIGGSLITAIFAAQALSPRNLMRGNIEYKKGGWFDRLRLLWPALAAATPAALGVLALIGFYYTAQVLAWRLFATVCFLATVLIVRALLLRSLMLRRRNLSIEQAKARAAEAASAAAAAGETSAEGTVAGIITSTPQADLTTHSQQTRRLVSTAMFATSAVGLWLIWVQVLPALGMLDRYPLWNNAGIAAQTASVAAPGPMNPATPGGEQPTGADLSTQEPSVTTLSDLVFALLIAFVTFVLARNGPGLLEMSVLQQLPLEPSVRYATTTLVSYVIVMVGVAMACSTLGLQWSQIQWLATALTFGLAFGLQEMFANFVAGLIILLERPIRVGDIVTVDDVTGVVSRIKIRATSITNWDRKEYVVPNKEFITGRLLNWTLSDKVNRIVIEVGIAYGSDTDRAREILLTVAKEHPLTLDDPPTLVTFEGFGDNSLNLVLRTYLPTLDNRLEVIHNLHTQINKAFRAEGIEIAFPQRDLHIRSGPAALGIALNGDRAERAQGKEAA